MEPLETLIAKQDAEQEKYNANSTAAKEEEEEEDEDDNKKPATSIKRERRIPLVRKEIKRRRAITIPRINENSSEVHGRDIVSVLQNDSYEAISSRRVKRRKRERLIANSQLHNVPNKKRKQIQFRGSYASFDDRLEDLIAYKDQHGHCDVPQIGEFQSLGQWCAKVRRAKRTMDKNGKPEVCLSDDQMKRLDDIGFLWNSIRTFPSFDDRLKDLIAYKDQHGHCDVRQNGEFQSLGKWCCKVRWIKRKMDKNRKPKGCLPVSDDQMKRLNDIGFLWISIRTFPSFDDRLEELIAYKDQHGHCDVRQSGEFQSLGHWCAKVRRTKRTMDKNGKPKVCLSDDQMKRLNDMGFLWISNRSYTSFDDHLEELIAYKDQHGHCDVHKSDVHKNAEFKPLWQWCAKVRWIKRIMDKNGKPRGCLSDDQMKRLNDIGFLWYSNRLRRSFE